MKDLGGFFMWIIVGGLFALGCAFYDMAMSTVGKDKVSQLRKTVL